MPLTILLRITNPNSSIGSVAHFPILVRVTWTEEQKVTFVKPQSDSEFNYV